MHRIIIGALVLATLGCSPAGDSPGDSTSCLKDLGSHRSSIDESFATDEYPLSEEQKADFDGLDYYPPDAKYCIPARFNKAEGAEVFQMPTNKEELIPFREFGVFEFRIDGAAYSLTAYQRMDLPEDERQWTMVPFKDKTNGHETYGGGRYLVIEFPIDSQTQIDFNRATNPWCVYSAEYTCPVPPVKNWLDLPIEAGEKMFGAAHSDSG